MEENDQKSRLSLAYISAVAAHAGYQVGELHRVDNDSIDGTIMSGQDRRPRIEFQAKATAQRVRCAGDHTFRLSVKNYDDLRIDVITPRLLIVVFLPAKEADWLVQSEDELRIRHCGYWLSLAGQTDTANRRKVSVRIPRSQVFDTAQLHELMGRVNRGEPL
jgi:hypothetical protein